LFITIGAFFILIAGLGLVRMPDLFLRMSASTKAATLGVGCTLLGVALYFGDFATFIRAGAIITFLLLTAPIAAHLLGRAAYQDGVLLWKGTVFDDLRRNSQ
jgi:multicomponent Na+:H+ antiporter subunit G